MFRPIAHIAAAIEVDLVSDVCDDAASFCHSGRTKGHQVVLQEIQPSCLHCSYPVEPLGASGPSVGEEMV